MASRGAEAGKLAELKAEVEGLAGIRRDLADDLIAAYVDVCHDYQELNAQLARDGLLIEVEKGGAENRHLEKVKHPAFDMRRNCISQMADLANKIARFVDDASVPEPDEFDAF